MYEWDQEEIGFLRTKKSCVFKRERVVTHSRGNSRGCLENSEADNANEACNKIQHPTSFSILWAKMSLFPISNFLQYESFGFSFTVHVKMINKHCLVKIACCQQRIKDSRSFTCFIDGLICINLPHTFLPEHFIGDFWNCNYIYIIIIILFLIETNFWRNRYVDFFYRYRIWYRDTYVIKCSNKISSILITLFIVIAF